ncbi:murein hydrolase activator EnvC family protein [Anaerobranca gottschalkii]|uniref:Peptidase family M23 n=1 Tax=Anaerobranca gottschalkii DSM 13577 TaxID=1120990 RepID=A0A1I0CG99_9FIRM|nr:M23 family metallopeptidase [Anaerobranca gottschalkii]SET18593.1 Peptidase family M23 [Anaerobranca gottschalkii DSM 13577]
MNILNSGKEKILKVYNLSKIKLKEIINKIKGLPTFIKRIGIYCLVVLVMFSYMAWQKSRLPLDIIGELPKNETQQPGEKKNNELPWEIDEIEREDRGVEEKTEKKDEKRDESEEKTILEEEKTTVEEETAQPVFNIKDKIIWPVEGSGEIQGHFKQPFNFRDGSFEYKLDGILIAAPKGSKVRAALPGVVKDVVRETSYLYGNVVKISYVDPNGDTWDVYYYNLDNIQVEEGQKVSIGDSIGYVGSNLLSSLFSESHIVLEIKKNNVLIDPQPYF